MYNIDEWNVDMLAVSEAVGRPLLRTACTVMEQFDLGHVHGASRETLAPGKMRAREIHTSRLHAGGPP